MIRLILLGLGFAWPYIVNLFWYVLASLGAAWVSFGLVKTVFDNMVAQVSSSVGGVPSAVAQFASIAGAGYLVAGLIGGLTLRVSLNGIGLIRRMVFRRAA